MKKYNQVRALSKTDLRYLSPKPQNTSCIDNFYFILTTHRVTRGLKVLTFVCASWFILGAYTVEWLCL